MKKYFDVLGRCPLFHNVSEQDLPLMLECLEAKVVCYKTDEMLIAEGEPAGYVGIVLSGAVRIVRDDYWGNRSIVADIEPSELFGESFACAGLDAVPVSVVAARDVAVMLIDCMRMTRSCGHACTFHQQMIQNLLKILAQKNLLFHQKIEVTSKRTTREKLTAYLLMQAKRNHSGSFEIPYNRQELADYLEVDRSGLSVEIGKLVKQGFIEADKKRFRIIKAMDVSCP